MGYAFKILWRDWFRYVSAVLAVTFSAMLMAIQCGLLLGLVIYTSVPIDHTSADIWITTPDAPALSLGQPIPDSWLRRVAAMPEVERVEALLEGGSEWHKPNQSSMEMCMVIGFSLSAGASGRLRELPAGVCARLSEPGTVVVDESELPKLGLLHGAGEFGEINQTRVRVVGTVQGLQGFTGPFIFCSHTTARMLLPLYEEHPDLAMYILARCRHPADAPAVVARLRQLYPDMGVYTAEAFSEQTRTYWLLRSKAGTVMTCTVVLALLVGLVVTSQTLYGAIRASLREYAVLDALGIPRSRLRFLVLAQSFWIGAVGLSLALPLIFGLSWAALLYNTTVLLPGWVMFMTLGLTMAMVLGSGLGSLRALRYVEPAILLR